MDRQDRTAPLTPADPGYASETAGFQTAYAHRPDLVAVPAGTAEVRDAVTEAVRLGLPVAVQATGHGLSVAADGGMLLATRRMDDVRIDPAARTAHVGAGVRSGALVAAAAAHGLAPLNGSAPSVGFVGYTLGGGVGLLAREFGYAADRVRSLELVTADGAVRRPRPGEALFGAVLGTGGNYGVVTSLEVELFPVPTLYGGQLVYDDAMREPVLDAWRQVCAAAPETLTSSVSLIPGELAGRPLTVVKIVYDGPAGQGERLVAPLRAAGPRLKDDLRVMPYAESHTIHNDPDDPHPYAATNALLAELPDTAQRLLLDATGPGSPVPCVVDIRHLGGALSRPGPAGVAVDHRGAEFAVRVIGMPTAGTADAVRERHALVRASLAPWTLGHSLAFLYGDGDHADEAQTRAGYERGTYDRLAALKAAYDPGNVFRFNRNIRPAQAVPSRSVGR